MRGFAAAPALIDQAARHPCRRLLGVVSPMQIDTCTAELLYDSRDAAGERGLPFTVHVSQNVAEVRELLRRHGKTPVRWAHEIGILGHGTILGHALFLDTHSWIRWWTRTDLKLIAETRSSAAHCPTPFARYGQILESFGDYLRADGARYRQKRAQSGRGNAQGGDPRPHRGARHRGGDDSRTVSLRQSAAPRRRRAITVAAAPSRFRR